MSTADLTVHVDPAIANAYRAALEQDRREMVVLVSMRLTEFLQSP